MKSSDHVEYLEIFEKSFPKRTFKKSVKIKFKNPWYNTELIHLNDEKEKNYLNYIRNRSSSYLKKKYIESRNTYFRKVKLRKREFFQNHLSRVKNDAKGTWKVINSVLGRTKGNQLFKLSCDGREVKNETEIANEFNKYFSKVAIKLVNGIPVGTSRKRFDKYLGERNAKSFFFNFTNPMEIYKILRSLASKFSSGCTGKKIKICPGFNRLFTDYEVIICLTDYFR